MTDTTMMNHILPANTPIYFDDFLTRDGGQLIQQMEAQRPTPLPATNIFETLEDIVIEIAAPGLGYDQLTVEATDSSLDIRYEPPGDEFEPITSRREWHNEFRPAAFRRVFEMNIDVADLPNFSGSATNGVIRFVIGKKESFRGRVAPMFPFSNN